MDQYSPPRLFRRVKFVTNSEVVVNGVLHQVTVLDISLRGILVSFADDTPSIEPGLSCEVIVYLNESLLKLLFSGELVHTRDRLAGIRFTRVALNSMIHLRRLLELNTGDGDLVKTELDSFISSFPP